MPENTEILVSLTQHEERIGRNREDVRSNREDIESCKEVVNMIRTENGRRDERIDRFQWFALLIAGGLATLAFAMLKQGMVR